jgi:hypothetical protein
MSQRPMQKRPKYVEQKSKFKKGGNISSKKDIGRDAQTKRLDVIIRLLMNGQRSTSEITKNDQILILDSVGLTDNEIGKVVGWTPRDVGSKLSKLRRS